MRYDYPQIRHVNGKLVKGCSRVGCYQSVLCFKIQVRGAFAAMSEGVKVGFPRLHGGKSMRGVARVSSTGYVGCEPFFHFSRGSIVISL